jgi:hypothetical protein
MDLSCIGFTAAPIPQYQPLKVWFFPGLKASVPGGVEPAKSGTE